MINTGYSIWVLEACLLFLLQIFSVWRKDNTNHKYMFKTFIFTYSCFNILCTTFFINFYECFLTLTLCNSAYGYFFRVRSISIKILAIHCLAIIVKCYFNDAP